MRIVIDEDGERLEIDVEDRCSDRNPEKFEIAPADGFGGTDIYIDFVGHINWKDLDVLKEAIETSEERWRK